MRTLLALLLTTLVAGAQTGLRSPVFASNLHPPAVAGGGGAVSNFPSGPAVLQHVSFSQTYGQAIVNNGIATFPLNEKTQGGNAVIFNCIGGVNTMVLGLGFQEVGGQKWTAVVTNNDAGHTESSIMYIATNVPVGCRWVYMTNKSGNTINFAQFTITEVCNINPDHPIDVVSSTNGTAAVVACPGITPTVSGDFIMQYTASDGSVTNPIYMVPTNQANFDQHFLSTDLSDFTSVQCGVYSSTTKFQPTVVNSLSTANISICAAFRGTNNQGNWRPFGRPYIAGIHHLSQAAIANSFSAPETQLTNVMQFPVYGNLVVIAGVGAGGMYATQTLSQAGMTFRRDPLSLGTNHLGTNNEVSDFWFVTNALPSTSSNVVSVTNFWLNTTNGAVGADSTKFVYDVVQCDGFVYDTGSTNVGDQLAGTGIGRLAQPGPITPSFYGIGFVEENHEFNTTTNLIIGSPSTFIDLVFDSSNCDQWNNDGPMNPDQNGGWAHFLPTNTGKIYFNWQFKSNNATGVLRSYAAHSALFKGAVALPAPPVCNSGLSGMGVTNTATDQTTYTIVTTNRAPANALLLCAVHNSKATTPEVPTLAGLGVQWVLIGTTNETAGMERLSVFRAMTNDTPQVGNIVASFAGATQTGCNMQAMYVTNVALGGSQGSGAVVQVAQTTNSTANPVITLGALLGSTNGVFAAFANDVNGYGATSIDAGWTQFVQNGYATPAAGQLGVYAFGTADNTVSITDGAQVWLGIALEIQKACP